MEPLNWELLAKYLVNEADDNATQQIKDWANESEQNGIELARSHKMMDNIDLWFENRRFNSPDAWEKIEQHIAGSKPEIQKPTIGKTFSQPMFRVAASIFLALALGVLGYFIGFKNHRPAVFTEVITTERQVVSGIKLPDGSMVTLNGNSALTFPKAFSGNSREITLSGEAFFKIAPDPLNPLVITAGDAQIKVLGTSFYVSAYPGADAVEVVVETGKVEISSPGKIQTPVETLNLEPGEKGTVSNDQPTLIKSINTNKNLLSWWTKNFIFEETPLSEVIAQLQKVYFVNIQLADPQMNEMLLSANFNNQPVDFILDVIRLTFNYELTAMNGQYFLTHNSNNK